MLNQSPVASSAALLSLVPAQACTGGGLSSLSGYTGILPLWQNPCFLPCDFHLSSFLTFLSNAKPIAPFRKLLLLPPWPGVSPSSQSPPSQHISTRDLWGMSILFNIYLNNRRPFRNSGNENLLQNLLFSFQVGPTASTSSLLKSPPKASLPFPQQAVLSPWPTYVFLFFKCGLMYLF